MIITSICKSFIDDSCKWFIFLLEQFVLQNSYIPVWVMEGNFLQNSSRNIVKFLSYIAFAKFLDLWIENVFQVCELFLRFYKLVKLAAAEFVKSAHRSPLFSWNKNPLKMCNRNNVFFASYQYR
jgi:hypothetical protein